MKTGISLNTTGLVDVRSKRQPSMNDRQGIRFNTDVLLPAANGIWDRINAMHSNHNIKNLWVANGCVLEPVARRDTVTAETRYVTNYLASLLIHADTMRNEIFKQSNDLKSTYGVVVPTTSLQVFESGWAVVFVTRPEILNDRPVGVVRIETITTYSTPDSVQHEGDAGVVYTSIDHDGYAQQGRFSLFGCLLPVTEFRRYVDPNRPPYEYAPKSIVQISE